MKTLVDKYGNSRTVASACPDLAEYIENNVENLDEGYIKKLLPKIKCDSVVLGCTHYIYIKETVKEFYNCPVFDGIAGTRDNLVKKLGKNDHREKRAQKISFRGDFALKNSKLFKKLILKGGLTCSDI